MESASRSVRLGVCVWFCVTEVVCTCVLRCVLIKQSGSAKIHTYVGEALREKQQSMWYKMQYMRNVLNFHQAG